MTLNQIHHRATFSRNEVSILISLSGLWKLIFVGALVLGVAVNQASAAEDADFEIGIKLADMLRASRSVVSASQSLINDPNIGDKWFTGEKLVRKAETIYAERVGTPLIVDGLSARDSRLLDAQRQAMRMVVDGHQAEINRLGVGFKGFIPAIFARLVNEEFEAIAGLEARIRVTAPPDLVRNRKARPDPWEKKSSRPDCWPPIGRRARHLPKRSSLRVVLRIECSCPSTTASLASLAMVSRRENWISPAIRRKVGKLESLPARSAS